MVLADRRLVNAEDSANTRREESGAARFSRRVLDSANMTRQLSCAVTLAMYVLWNQPVATRQSRPLPVLDMHLHAMAANAQEVSRLARVLYDRLRTFTGYFADVGRGLDRALDSYNKGVGAFEARVLVTARKFKERGAISGDEIEPLEPIDKAARALALDEGGLFPDIVAGEETVLETSLPLLDAKAAGAQNGWAARRTDRTHAALRCSRSAPPSAAARRPPGIAGP